MKIASFFAGCGGLDYGFEKAGCNIIWANEFDNSIHDTYKLNHPNTILNTNDVRLLTVNDIPDCDGFIGGPPCQSWSEGGMQKGLEDERGKLFLNYVNLIKIKQPKFFVIENVRGILNDKHFSTFLLFLQILEEAGYTVHYKLLNSVDFRIPQDRHRVFVVGFLKSLNVDFAFPKEIDQEKITLQRAIGDIKCEPTYYRQGEFVCQNTDLSNHDAYVGDFDKKFMARNRVRAWNEPSYTIQAQAKNTPLHPQAPKMVYVSHDERRFVAGKEYLYRRLSVRECARIQTFPDSYKFCYKDICDGYKMVGNAVPPRLAYYIAISIKKAITSITNNKKISVLIGYYKGEKHLSAIFDNNLYYVRTGFRKGAFTMPVGTEPPQYLLLHNSSTIHFFELIITQPILMSKAELARLGFSPSGQVYLAFKIKKRVFLSIKQLSQLDINKERLGTKPYLLFIESFDI